MDNSALFGLSATFKKEQHMAGRIKRLFLSFLSRYAKFLEHSKTTHAMGRVGEVREVAETIVFLASNAASFITGQTLAIDGGRSVMCPR